VSIIVHTANLKIGDTPENELEMFASEIRKNNPDLIILSGNITANGHINEFVIAQNFISSFRAPVLCVPGSKDISSRFFDSFKHYRAYVSPIQDVVFEDDTMFVVGVNSARPVVPHWNWKNGMVSQDQIQFVHNQFRQAPNEKLRVFVCHHPLIAHKKSPSLVWGSTDLLRVLQDQQVDVVLTSQLSAVVHPSFLQPEKPVMVGAFGAGMGNSLSYNTIKISPSEIVIDLMAGDDFSQSLTVERPSLVNLD
jgi:3',5'-cyclic AMP phosphodiesterase CpdA